MTTTVNVAPKLIPAGGAFPASIPTMVTVAPPAAAGADAGLGLAGGLVGPLLAGVLGVGLGDLPEEEMPAELRLKQGLEEKKKRMEVGGWELGFRAKGQG